MILDNYFKNLELIPAVVINGLKHATADRHGSIIRN
jgi:hypothetical protein